MTAKEKELKHLVKMFAAQKGVQCDVLNRSLCQMAGIEKEYDHADNKSYKDVVHKAADILGVDIG